MSEPRPSPQAVLHRCCRMQANPLPQKPNRTRRLHRCPCTSLRCRYSYYYVPQVFSMNTVVMSGKSWNFLLTCCLKIINCADGSPVLNSSLFGTSSGTGAHLHCGNSVAHTNTHYESFEALLLGCRIFVILLYIMLLNCTIHVVVQVTLCIINLIICS